MSVLAHQNDLRVEGSAGHGRDAFSGKYSVLPDLKSQDELDCTAALSARRYRIKGLLRRANTNQPSYIVSCCQYVLGISSGRSTLCNS